MMTCLFGADVITQNTVCRQGPNTHPLLRLCQGHTHIITALSHTNGLCFVHREKKQVRGTLVLLGRFVSF